METKSFKLAVSAFIKYTGSGEHKGKYLLIQRSETCNNYKGFWETPGGKLDQGESFNDALIREIREETGLSVVLDGVVGATDFEMIKFRIAVLYMKAHTDSYDVQLSDEHQDSKWLFLSGFQSKTLTPALEGVLKNLKEGIL
jgi:8-oxo-dGTP diphosphatase